ncbi:NAD(P)-binding protein [Tistrella mobilis]|uniref:NAD(P)-binding protein n=1 Tax=Tistrella mobilis TaxID=171437 RepID=UPI0009DB37BF
MTSGFIDARNSDAGDLIEASVCIVGSGAAGLTLARRLAKSVKDVVLIESGAFHSRERPRTSLQDGISACRTTT